MLSLAKRRFCPMFFVSFLFILKTFWQQISNSSFRPSHLCFEKISNVHLQSFSALRRARATITYTSTKTFQPFPSSPRTYVYNALIARSRLVFAFRKKKRDFPLCPFETEKNTLFSRIKNKRVFRFWCVTERWEQSNWKGRVLRV